MNILSTISLCGLIAIAGAAVADETDEAQVPEQSMLGSVRQAFKEDFDHEVVRGHFDVGSPPDTRRYYCLVEEKNGQRQPNGVSGQPASRADGMTGIKANAVSVYSCASAEKKGLLVTTGYALKGKAAAIPSMPTTPAVVAATPESSAPRVDGAVSKDVAGVKLGMSLEEVRTVLRSKKLQDFFESYGASGQPAGGRFVNIVAAWTPPAGDAAAADWESYEVMFTPVPGKERAMAIIHSVGYAPGGAVPETVLKDGLLKKYGGYAAAAQMPAAPTWTFRSGGVVQAGDLCGRRSVVGGLSPPFTPALTRRNLSLTTTLDEFQSQIERCGAAIVTEDHSGSNGIVHFTVTAYSPALGLEGAQTAAQLMQPGSAATTGQARIKEGSLPVL